MSEFWSRTSLMFRTTKQQRFFFTSYTEYTNSSFSWLNKQSDLKGQHTVLLHLHVADPATFPASNSVLETVFPSEDSLII